MKKRILSLVALLLVFLTVASGALAVSTAKAKQRIATRTGPGTGYDDKGTYNLTGKKVKVFSKVKDKNDIVWVQIEVNYAGKLRRLYTGKKRFYSTAFPKIPDEYEKKAWVIEDGVQTYYGPGEMYEKHKTKLNSGKEVTVVYEEAGYSLVDVQSGKSKKRYYVETAALQFDD